MPTTVKLSLAVMMTLAFASCESAHDVIALVVSVDVRSECNPEVQACSGNYIEFGHCGGEFGAITPETQALDVISDLDPNEIDALVQLQHSGDYFPDGHGYLPQHRDFILEDGDQATVVASYDTERVIYRIDVTGAMADVDDSLVAEEDGSMAFEYMAAAADPFVVTERHRALPPRPIPVKTSDPDSIMNSCCAVATPQSASLTLAALAFALISLARRRRVAQH